MTLDRGVIGRTAGPGRSSWTASDALLYALAVGAGQDDPMDELDLTTENSEVFDQGSGALVRIETEAIDPDSGAPLFTTRGGMHGLCTLGIAGRVLTRAVCDGEPARIRSLSGRFTKPVLPGQDLTVSIWSDADRHLYRVTDSAGEAVIDFGSVTAGAPTR